MIWRKEKTDNVIVLSIYYIAFLREEKLTCTSPGTKHFFIELKLHERLIVVEVRSGFRFAVNHHAALVRILVNGENTFSKSHSKSKSLQCGIYYC